MACGMPSPAAIGFRAHSGWAAAVALVKPAPRPPDAPAAIMRRRIEMADRGAPLPSQPYHAAVGLDIREAEQHVANCAARAAALATKCVARHGRRSAATWPSNGRVRFAVGSGRPLPPLERILASHPLLHTAEGELFREALRAASRECGLPLTTVKERELFQRAPSADLHLQPSASSGTWRHGKGPRPALAAGSEVAAVAAWLALK
jgi:hypothetical protein